MNLASYLAWSFRHGYERNRQGLRIEGHQFIYDGPSVMFHKYNGSKDDIAFTMCGFKWMSIRRLATAFFNALDIPYKLYQRKWVLYLKHTETGQEVRIEPTDVVLFKDGEILHIFRGPNANKEVMGLKTEIDSQLHKYYGMEGGEGLQF